MQTLVEIREQQVSVSQVACSCLAAPSSFQQVVELSQFLVLVPGPRTSQAPHQGQFPKVCMLSHALHWLKVLLSSSYTGTHIFQELCILYSCISTFCFS